MEELRLTTEKKPYQVRGQMVAIASDGLNQVRVMKNVVTPEYRRDMMADQMVKLIVLEKDFNIFKDYTEDFGTQVAYKLKKNYNGRTWLKFPITLYKDQENRTQIGKSLDEESANAYLVISKRDIRMGEDKQGVMLRTETDKVKEKGNELINSYIERFNLIERGEVYDVHLEREDESDVVTDVIAPFNDDVRKREIFEEIISRTKFIDKVFDKLVGDALDMDSNEYVSK